MNRIQKGYTLLFFDLKELENKENLKRIVNQGTKHPSNPLLPLGKAGEWDRAQAYNYGLVYFDTEKRIFRNWYVATDGIWVPGSRDYRTGYALSDNGIDWKKPRLGLFEYNGNKDNNIVWPAPVMAVNIDRQEKDPARVYQMAVWDGTGTSIVYSADGLTWQGPFEQAWGWWLAEKPSDPVRKTGCEPRCLFRDPLETDPLKRYKMYGQMVYMGDYYNPGLRLFGMLYSQDGRKWHSHPDNPVLDPRDGTEDEIHIGTVWIYKGWYIGLYEYSWYHPVTGYFTCDIRLAVSRDGVHFDRIDNNYPLVPLGYPGAWDSGMVMTSGAPFLHENKVWFYYGANGDEFDYHDRSRPGNSCHTHPRRTGLVQWPEDGFTYLGVVPPYKNRGSFVTVPMELKNENKVCMVVKGENLDGMENFIRAELQTSEGRPIPGYEIDECIAVGGKGPEQRVLWKLRKDLSEIREKAIKIKVELVGRNTRLYSIGFR